MNRILSALLLLVCSSAWAAAGATINYKAYAQRVPAMPANAAAAAASFRFDTQSGEPLVPADVSNLRKELTELSNTALLAPAATSPAGMASMTAEQAQLMATKLQSMSQADQIAYAMQMQQQMMGGTPGASIVSDAEGKAMTQVSVEQEGINQDMQTRSTLLQRTAALMDAWNRAEQDIDSRASALDGNFYVTTDDPFVCSEKNRSWLLKKAADHIALANQNLAKAGALDKEWRTHNTVLIGRAERTAALVPQIRNGGMVQAAISARNLALGNALGGIDATADLYATSGQRAARWQHLQDLYRKARLRNCEGEGY